MHTLLLHAESENSDSIQEAAKILRNGGIVAFPTETVYGLGANALKPNAVRRVFEAKGRPFDNPVILHASEIAMVRELSAEIPATAESLMARFWPGPLTLILKRAERVPQEVTSELETVGLRIPGHPVARSLIRTCGFPLAAPSANLSGRPSPTTAEHVLQDLDGRIDAVLDAGHTDLGIESTVLDLTHDPALILRPGHITLEQIRDCLPSVEYWSPGKQDAPRSPGVKYRHYSPAAELILVEGQPGKVRAEITAMLERDTRNKTVVLTTTPQVYAEHACLNLGNTASIAAHNLFGLLRQIDSEGYERVIVELVEGHALGEAVMNRLRKAASKS